MNTFIRFTILFVLLFSFSQRVWAEGLQRLFTTAQERAALNAERNKPPPGPTKPITEVQELLLPKAPHYITFNGVVIRSQGPSTVWVNDRNELLQQGFQVEMDKPNDTSISIILPKGQRILLKPGQTTNTLDGTIKENFEQPAQ